MLIPEVVGFELTGAMMEGTADDLVLKVVQMLREKVLLENLLNFMAWVLITCH